MAGPWFGVICGNRAGYTLLHFWGSSAFSEGGPYEYDTAMAFKHMNISNKETREKKSY